jgi:hypothetical protein
MRFVQALPIHRQYIAHAMPIQNAMTLFVRKPPSALLDAGQVLCVVGRTGF